MTDEPSRFATTSTLAFTTSSSLLYKTISGAERYLDPVDVIPIDSRLKLSFRVIILGTVASGYNVVSEEWSYPNSRISVVRSLPALSVSANITADLPVVEATEIFGRSL